MRLPVPVNAAVTVLSASAWLVMLGESLTSSSPRNCCLPQSVSSAVAVSIRNLTTWDSIEKLAFGWIVMLAAMMSPMLIEPVKHIVDRSFAARRPRAVALFCLGYVAQWMLAGIAITGAVVLVGSFQSVSPLPIAAAYGVALLWQCSPLKQACLNRAHAHTELAAFGAEADLDAIRFGLTHGAWCVGSCWALMLMADLVTKGHFVAMLAVTFVAFGERFERPERPAWRWRFSPKIARIIAARLSMRSAASRTRFSQKRLSVSST